MTRTRRAPDPQKPCVVYRAFAADDSLLYIGLTAHPVDRLRQHAYGLDASYWWRDVARIEYEPVPNRIVGAAVEAEAIRTERPLHNCQHARGRGSAERVA